MSNGQVQMGRVDTAWLIALVARHLDIPAHIIKPNVPLTSYGFDSIAAVQLALAITEQLGCDVLDPLLLDHPDIHSLVQYLESALDSSLTEGETSTSELILADSILPSDIQPEPGAATPTSVQVVLLTGATGFLGAFLLHQLLRETPARIYCPVRAGKENPGERIRRNLAFYGIWDSTFAPRIVPLVSDLAAPRLGLAAERFDRLGDEVDEIYHVAASVNWVFPYEAVRDINVGGTVELLRLACHRRPKAFHHISSLAVCCSSTGPAQVNEDDEIFPHREGLHLGYVQSKCVAETLVAQARARRLPATIHRPSLLIADSRTGVSNPQDFLTRLIQGCVRMGTAPDLDWALDCCPVDHAARFIIALARRQLRSDYVFHLANPAPHRWRELVLWMNLFGYPIRLLPYHDWVEQLEGEARTPEHPLHLLRPFFRKQVTADNLTIPELYEEGRKPRIDSSRTQKALSRMALGCPTIDAPLLERIFNSFIAQKLLPPVRRRTQVGRDFRLDHVLFEDALREFQGDEALQVRRLTPLPTEANQSLLTDLASWGLGVAAGLTRYRVEWDRGPGITPTTRNVFVKVKPEDRAVLDVGQSMADICGRELGQAFARWKHRLGLMGSHARELEVYRLRNEMFRAYLPTVHGILQDDECRRWVLFLEDLSDLPLLNAVRDVRLWGQPQIEAALTGLAAIHSIWYERVDELTSWTWLGQGFSSGAMVEMTDLWQALADHASKYFRRWIGPDIGALQDTLIAEVGHWWSDLVSLPRTLLHGDFNPRNLALRQTATGFGLCAYDWELATLGVPQRDLAEFLCFVLTPQSDREEIEYYVEYHRHVLARASGRCIDAGAWSRGFGLSLCDLIINRLPLYCLVHPFRPQPFLERVICTWRRLYEVFSPVVSL